MVTAIEPIVSDLPESLRALVRDSVALLGQVIREDAGDLAFERIEGLRREMAALRHASIDTQGDRLGSALGDLEVLTLDERAVVAHAFTLMLELMNSCENAYRTSRIRARPPLAPLPKAASGESKARTVAPDAITLVLTSHPTEARSPRNIRVFALLQTALIDALERGFEGQRERLKSLIQLAWRIDVARSRKPTVQDEAEHLFSVSLHGDALDAWLEAASRLGAGNLRMHAWVGADRDGHPLVNEQTLMRSFSASRSRLLDYAECRLEDTEELCRLVEPGSAASMARALGAVRRALRALRCPGAGDSGRVARLGAVLRRALDVARASLGTVPPPLKRIGQLLEAFPALVVPLEIRDTAAGVREALFGLTEARSTGSPPQLARMLGRVAQLAGKPKRARKPGQPLPEHYSPALILSHTVASDDVRAGCELVSRVLGSPRLPVIPLLEDSEILAKAFSIVDGALANPVVARAVRDHWSGRFETMLGYSDSAKESGMLSSRLAITQAMAEIERACLKHKVVPRFFHGAGGSVDRGGGSIDDQTAAWPASAVRGYKATIQGEMVERTFSSPEILISFLSHISECQNRNARRVPVEARAALVRLAETAAENYRAKACSPDFINVVEEATIYPYLNHLRLGSRPPARKGTSVRMGDLCPELSSIRAIPWVLCWTQARALFPSWWGVGSAWAMLPEAERQELAAAYEKDPFFRTYIHQLGFTLAKVELAVWRTYLVESDLDPDQAHAVELEFAGEYRSAVEFVRSLAGENLLGFRPWLGTSVRLRSPMIHPLNLLQLLVLRDRRKGRNSAQNGRLLRETVTGIASGMLTTG